MTEEEVRTIVMSVLAELGVALKNDSEVPEALTLDGTEMLFGMRTVGGTPSYFKTQAGAIGIPQTATVKAVRSLTQAEYDALAVKDATTLYVIVN